MTKFSRHVFIGAALSGVLLAGHAYYLGSEPVMLADALLFFAIVICWSYLLKQASSGNVTVDSSGSIAHDAMSVIHESSSFHSIWEKADITTWD